MEHSRRFGRIEIRPVERAVLIDGHAAALGSRAFDILMALVERHERLVTKDELMDVVWPGLVVEENNLAVHVSALRKLLGPQAIATVPGRGYRFVATLDEAVPAAAEPVAAAASAPSNDFAALPLPAAALLGRDEDLAALEQSMQSTRWVTLVGAGGIGKTSLALAAAHARRGQHRNGAAWVDMGEISDPLLLPSAIAQATGLAVGAGGDPVRSLAELLKPFQMLLVLDNAEHLLDGVTRFARTTIAHAPGVHLLITSQVALKADGEQVFRLEPLSVPQEGAGVAQAMAHGAVALFVEQAHAADRRFAITDENVDAVTMLCRSLDGVPLALKLAAARMPLLGLQGLVSRLGERLRLLRNASRDAPARQQTLLAALDWSHGLLGVDEQAVFRRLGVFSGGFSLDMAGAVAGDDALDAWAVIDALAELVDRSLVAMEGRTTPRYRLLETARDYARARLDEAGEQQATRQRHAHATAALMDDASASYWATPDVRWLDCFAVEIENVRSALDWSTRHEPELAIRLAGASSFLFMLLGQAAEGRRWFALLQAHAQQADHDANLARYWLERSRLTWGVSNASMRDYALKALKLFRDDGDAQGQYLAWRCITGSDAAPAETGAAPAEMVSLERPEWPPRLRAQRWLAEISVLGSTGRHKEACRGCEELLALARNEGLDSVAAAALASLCNAHLCLNEPDQALSYARRLIAEPSARRGNFILHALGTAAEAYLIQEQVGQASEMLVDFMATSRNRDWEWLALYADVFAHFAACEGRVEAAARLIGYADAAFRRVGSRSAFAVDARSRASAIVQAAIDARTIERLMDEGARMGELMACEWALGRGLN